MVDALRRAGKQTIHAFEETLAISMMLVLSLAPAAAAIAVGYLIAKGLPAVGLMASASLGAFAVWRLRDTWNRRVDRPSDEQSTPCRQTPARPVVAAAMAPMPHDLIAFHDFNRERNRFDHW